MIVVAVGLGVLALLAVLPSWAAVPLSWLLVGYVLWRAYPAVRRDVAVVTKHRVQLPGRRGGGAHL